MSAKITLGTTLTGLVLLIIIGIVVITGSQANEQAAKQAQNDSAAAKAQSIQNNKDIKQIEAVLTDFIKDRNAAFNQTFEYQKAILDLQLNNEKNIIDNLTTHRIISNLSNANQTQILYAVLNATHALTSDEYNKAAENKVASIIGNMSAEHDIIFEALNISKTDGITDAENDTENLGQLLKDFIQDQKVKQNKPQGPKS